MLKRKIVRKGDVWLCGGLEKCIAVVVGATQKSKYSDTMYNCYSLIIYNDEKTMLLTYNIYTNYDIHLCSV